MAKTYNLFRLLSGSFTENGVTYRADTAAENFPKIASERRLDELFKNKFELLDENYPHAEFKAKKRKPKGPINLAKVAKEKAAAKKAEEKKSKTEEEGK